jgi:hypothetical protein
LPQCPLKAATQAHCEGQLVKKTEEYLQHAKDCQRLAKQMENGDQRDQLVKNG